MTEVGGLPVTEAEPVVMATIGDDQIKLERSRGTAKSATTPEHI